MHTLPYAAWAAVMTLLAGAAPPADVPVPACAIPDCLEIAHGFLMSRPVATVAEGKVVQWRADAGHHLLVEGASSGGCLALALEPGHPFARVGFVVHDGGLTARHATANGTRALRCSSAIELPGGAFALRYSCALHAREGGIGLLIVSDDDP